MKVRRRSVREWCPAQEKDAVRRAAVKAGPKSASPKKRTKEIVMRKLIRRIAALFITALMLFGAVGCGKVETPSFIKEYLCVEHTYGEGQVTRWATCAREGRVKYECTECGHVKYESLVSTAHTPYTVPLKMPTCAESGYREYKACAVCGKALEEVRVIESPFICESKNEYYAGVGVYKCALCGKSKTEYSGFELKNTNDGLQNFELGAGYRFYLPNEDSVAIITFTWAGEDGGYFGERGPSGNKNEIYEFSIGFKGKTQASVWFGDIGYQSDLSMKSAFDYIDVWIAETFISGSATYNKTDTLELTLSSEDIDVRRGVKVTLKGGAKIVRLDGVTEF